MSNSHLKLCYVLAYRQPTYIRTVSLLKALQQIQEITLFTAINRKTGILRYIDTIWQLIQIRWKHNPDYYILGFRGHEIFWFIKLITVGKPLIFDSLLSPSAALIGDKKQGNLGVFLGKILFYFEKSILHHANYILTDTQLHVDFLCKQFCLPPNKVFAIPVGADETLPSISPIQKTHFEVLFYGSFLPLHGMSIMLEAASHLKDKPIHFVFIGGNGKNLKEFKKLQEKFSLYHNISHIEWVDFSTLIHKYIPNADLGLGGAFGNTPQAQRVITGKTSQFLALGKPTIVGKIKENIDFIDKKNCLLVEQGDVFALVTAIEWAYQHQVELPAIGQAGLQLYQKQLSIKQISQVLKKVLKLC
ncbi:glycosyltransferase [Beggiatoa leptomitoformis]|uniref:Glycosyltransferase n=1 Tax=Beggiatoa leptomitoformis TaxID=288004 RepID=A0A2N9YAS6_9GAMM|nr:glycosyltransferase [Beggiatoa leptomitoformis]ALG67064.1 glycosyltransferase [Beggiatoa leptomitoformis]AUI67550.2 glycosyltransferase [Beggiatoa leptomitoformis]